MALQTLSESEVVLLGWSPPRDYKAGKTDTGIDFPAGRSMRICVGTEEHDFNVVKVDKEAIDAVYHSVAPLGRGVACRLTFTQKYGEFICIRLEALASVGKS